MNISSPCQEFLITIHHLRELNTKENKNLESLREIKDILTAILEHDMERDLDEFKGTSKEKSSEETAKKQIDKFKGMDETELITKFNYYKSTVSHCEKKLKGDDLSDVHKADTHTRLGLVYNKMAVLKNVAKERRIDLAR